MPPQISSFNAAFKCLVQCSVASVVRSPTGCLERQICCSKMLRLSYCQRICPLIQHSAFKASPSCTNYLSIVLRSSEFPRVGSSGCFSSKSSFPLRIQRLTEFHEKKRRKMFNKILGQVFPRGSAVKNPPANAGNTGWFPGLGRSHMLGSSSAWETQGLSPHAATTGPRVPRARALQ